MLSCDVSLGMFDRGLSDVGILGVAGVNFDVSGGGLVWATSRLLVSVDTGNGDQFPMTTTARSLTGGSKCCGWLQFMTRGAGHVAPPIGMQECIVDLSQGGGMACIWIVYTRQGSVTALQVTRSLLLQFLLCYLIVVSVRSCLRFEGNQGCCEESLSIIPGLDSVQ